MVATGGAGSAGAGGAAAAWRTCGCAGGVATRDRAVQRARRARRPGRARRRARRGWGVVVTGHSLGAGAAALVALYLRNFYPETRAWAFSPPGGLVDSALAGAAAACVTSVAVGKDWVPRLSLASFERLRDDMARARPPALPPRMRAPAPRGGASPAAAARAGACQSAWAS